MASVPSFLIPAGESQRLSSIRRYEVMQTLQDDVFSGFVTLTARIFGVPISLLALVDEAQVWYHANYGLPHVHDQPREEALCATAILNDYTVVYHDLDHELPPVVTAEAAAAARAKALRFYAAAPVCTPDQALVGSICVIDRQPRAFNAGEQRLLKHIAALISQLIAAAPAGPWPAIRALVQDELQSLGALVRYIVSRHGTQVPVSPEMLVLLGRRLFDLSEGVAALAH